MTTQTMPHPAPLAAPRSAPAFVPPHPTPPTRPLGTLALLRNLRRNPLEIWGSLSYERPTLDVTWWGIRTVVVNDPALILPSAGDEPGELSLQRRAPGASCARSCATGC